MIFIIFIIYFLFKKKSITKQEYKHNIIDIHNKINKYNTKTKHNKQKECKKKKLLWELYFMYFNGVLDKYDSYGYIIERGIEPNPFKMFEILDKLENIQSEKQKVYLEKAKLYEQGFHNFPPCYELSKRYYKMAGIEKTFPVQQQQIQPEPIVLDFYRNIQNNNPVNNQVNRNLYNDPQNVHDTTIMNKMKEVSKHLIHSEQNMYDEIKEEIHKRLTGDKLNNAIQVLDTMYSSNGMVDKYNKKEVDIISDTYNTLKHVGNDDYMNIFCEELSSGVEWGKVVCTIGRANRVLNSLTGIETNNKNNENIDISLLRPEMLNKASKLYTDNIDKEPEEIKQIIKTDLLNDYTHINKNIVETEINSWINDII